MSVEAMTWALAVPIGGARKLVLIGLGNHAHADGSHAFPTVETLAKYAHVDRRTVQRALRWLATEGLVREGGKGPNGQTSYTLSMSPYVGAAPEGGDILPPAASVSPGGGTQVLDGAAPTSPEPSFNRPRTVQVVVERASEDIEPVRRALAAAGFDRLTIEANDSAIRLALSQADAPPDLDWFAIGVQMEAKRRSGDMKTRRPDGALNFMFRGMNSLPRIGQPDRPLFGDKPLTGHAALTARRMAVLRGDA